MPFRLLSCLALFACSTHPNAPLEDADAAAWLFADALGRIPLDVYQVAPHAVYARGTANLFIPGVADASAGLITDNTLITADHLFQGGNGPGIARFGQYGPTPGDVSTGIARARQRLKQLGIPVATANTLPEATLTDFDCSKTSSVTGEDVAYWDCDPNTITFDVDGTSVTYDLYPGHLWGAYKVRAQNTAAGQSVYMAAYNWQCEPGTPPFNAAASGEVLVSFGFVDDTVVPCPQPGATTCFGTAADGLFGTSGAPTMDDSAVLTGVYQGSTWFDPSSVPNSSDWCLEVDPNGGRNVVSHVPGIPTLNQLDTPTGSPRGPNAASSGRLGYTTATKRVALCPDDMFVAGLVGTSNAGNTVGNIGLVCTTNNDAFDLQLDTAVVLSHGSLDVPSALNGSPIAMNEFLAEYTGDEQPGLGEHTLAMCPPGYLLRGIRGTETGTTLGRIHRLMCEDPRTNDFTMVDIWAGTQGAIGTFSTGTNRTIGCASNRYWRGATIWSDDETEGIRGRCAYAP